MHAAGAAGAIVALSDCSSNSTPQTYPPYGAGSLGDAGADTSVVAEASVGDASSTTDASEADAEDAGKGEAAVTDAPGDAPDGD